MRDPLSSYPEPKAAEDLSPPKNCAFVYTKSVDWLRAHYPQVRDWVASSKSTGEEMWDMVEWVDEDVTVVGVLGPRDWENRTLGASGAVVQSMELHRWPNPTGLCPVYIPGRGEMHFDELRIDYSVKKYDERLFFGRNADTGDWCVFIKMPRPMNPYPVIGFGQVVPPLDVVMERIQQANTIS